MSYLQKGEKRGGCKSVYYRQNLIKYEIWVVYMYPMTRSVEVYFSAVLYFIDLIFCMFIKSLGPITVCLLLQVRELTKLPRKVLKVQKWHIYYSVHLVRIYRLCIKFYMYFLEGVLSKITSKTLKKKHVNRIITYIAEAIQCKYKISLYTLCMYIMEYVSCL